LIDLLGLWQAHAIRLLSSSFLTLLNLDLGLEGRNRIKTPEYIQGVCEVCRFNDHDVRPKKVTYCDFCGAYICEKDLYNPGRRVKAFFASKGLSFEGLRNWARTHPE
jgi:hypothetical protein